MGAFVKKIFTLLILIVFLSACTKKEPLNFADAVFNPQNSYGRELKAKYSVELLNIVNKFSEYGINVQQKGVGFTKGETCKDCEYKEVLFALKTVDLDKLKYDKSFKGVLISGIWGTYTNIKQRVKTENFETVDIYIPKDPFFDYIDGNIKLENILEFAKAYAKNADEKDLNVEKVF